MSVLAKDGSEVDLGLGAAAAEAIVGKQQPEDQPDHAHRACRQEGRLPAELGRDEGDKRWGDERRGVRAGVENAGGEGAFV